ncbi:MAG: Lrp/AsnC family transcriptional regulator [Propionibacteriaceae bacterium]|nr:Lrp/AsnC family transcriptional regulator [Propionibacteriaceae bacterium]
MKDERQLDDIDRKILQTLLNNGRLPNAAVAKRVNIAESTCYERVQYLIKSGVIKGFHTRVDMSALGRPIRAVALLKVRSGFRDQLLQEAQRLSGVEGVIRVLFLAGTHDLMVEFAVASSNDLRDFVVNELNSSEAVADTATSVVMEALEGSKLSQA